MELTSVTMRREGLVIGTTEVIPHNLNPVWAPVSVNLKPDTRSRSHISAFLACQCETDMPFPKNVTNVRLAQD